LLNFASWVGLGRKCPTFLILSLTQYPNTSGRLSQPSLATIATHPQHFTTHFDANSPPTARILQTHFSCISLCCFATTMFVLYVVLCVMFRYMLCYWLWNMWCWITQHTHVICHDVVVYVIVRGRHYHFGSYAKGFPC